MIETILDGTARVLADHGIARLTTNLIAEVAGVSIGSVYQYFEDKDALLEALHLRHSVQMRRAMTQVLRDTPHDDLRGIIGAFARALLIAHFVEPALHRELDRLFPIMIGSDDRSDADLDVQGQLVRILERYRGEVAPSDLDYAAWFTVNAIHALVHQAVLYPPGSGFDVRLEHSITDAVMGFLGGPSQ